MGYLEERRKELQQELKDKIRKDFKEYDDKLYGLYVSQEAQKDFWMDHYHICTKAIIASGFMYPDLKDKVGKKIVKRFKRECKEYLASQGKEPDECLTCCDDCPYMKFVVLDDNKDILVII